MTESPIEKTWCLSYGVNGFYLVHPMFGSFHQGSLYQVVPPDTGGMYQSDRGLVRMVHTGLSLYPIVSYVGMLVWFNTCRTDDRSVHRYGPIRRTMVFISNYFVRSRV